MSKAPPPPAATEIIRVKSGDVERVDPPTAVVTAARKQPQNE